jgi:hypothetical protein
MVGKIRFNLKGQKIARLTVLERVPNDRFNRACWLCRCDCGRELVVATNALRTGNTRSCGCLMRDRAAQICTWRNTSHGESGSPEHVAWLAMKERVRNPNHRQFHNYGGRGIKVCDRWLNSYENFLADVGRKPTRKHTLDRIDVDGDYEPGNVRWATLAEQQSNKTTNVFVSAFGERLTVSQWARKTGVGRHNISNRLKAGWTPEQAVMTPAKYGQRIARSA